MRQTPEYVSAGRASGLAMRISAGLAAFLVVLCACTPAPSAMDLESDELEHAPNEAFAQIPDDEWAAATDGEPEREFEPPRQLGDGTVPRYVLAGDGTIDDCFSVNAIGMPAIDVTGALLATSEEQWLQLSPLHGQVDLHLVDLEAEVSTVIPIVAPDTYHDDDERICKRLRARIRRQVHAANAELAAHRWRALEPLPVEYGNPDTPPETREDIAVAERPLQVIVQHGEAIVRIPGVKVHERHPIPGRRDGYALYAVHGDRETGVVAFTFADCAGDSCTCDPLFTTEIMHWSPATFAALDAHPCSDPEAEDGRCRGIDYGF